MTITRSDRKYFAVGVNPHNENVFGVLIDIFGMLNLNISAYIIEGQCTDEQEQPRSECADAHAGIIFWRDFAIFSHFFARNRIKILGVRKKNRMLNFSQFLFCTCGSFRDYRTVLFDRFLNYCGAKIHYAYDRR